MKRKLHKIGLTLYFSITIFVMHLVTFSITALIVFTSISLGWLHEDILEDPIGMTLLTIIACIIVATIVLAISSRKILYTIHQIIEVTDKLASGDFSARLQLSHPPEYKILSENFNRMAEELGGIEVLRTDFINNFSHEFKTPIVSIKGFAEVLKDDNLSKEARDEYLDIVIEESTRLSSLATNVLNLSKIETQSILTNKQCFNLGEQIRQSVLLLEPQLEKNKLLFEADIQDYYVSGNKEMLNQVWLNLLDNAIKFTPTHGMIEIAMKEIDSVIVVKISDTGCGIKREAIPKIFDKFYQQDTSHATKGNGLGLTIVHSIISFHKGTIRCDSTLSFGTTFTITIPKE